ncbi:hypothetical protein [Sphingobium sp. DC-2]|uniref:hypothetical protein n=1 Tax=Sphingobium sp. DC-2 TaxID=1303256 RepID=UPI0004C3D338|nr:hypothetical protein [Sphingobium sp. DC-2]
MAEKVDQNPFHSRWWRCWEVAAWPLRYIGIIPVLVRCRWTRSNARIGLAYIGITALMEGEGR